MTRTLYRPVWDGIQSALRDIFREGFPADKVIQRHLKSNRKWGSHDRKLFAEAVYDLVRWWRRLMFAVDAPWPADDKIIGTAEPKVLARVTEAWCVIHDVRLDPNIAKQGLSPESISKVWSDASLPRAVRESVPDWLDQWGSEELGARWDEVLPVLNTLAPVYLRANRLKCSPKQLLEELKQDRVEARIVDGDCLQLAERANVFLSKSFSLGHFEVQDGNSQQVAPALQAEPGMRVIDACAGAGGKSLHLAALMKNKGKIIAMDVSEKKLEQLRERSTRDGATCIETRVIDTTKVIKRLKDGADRVLLDVPCTGLGVLRRNPDSKWKLTRAEVSSLREIQAQILGNYAQMCKPGGVLVYATCSIAPSENEAQIQKFVSQNETKWTLDVQSTFYPQRSGPDGFYFARLRRS
jgi:16S rRNA (cytosine967-C5)-methyltransferase